MGDYSYDVASRSTCHGVLSPRPEKEPERKLIAASSLRQAVKYFERRFDGDFVLHKAECLGIMILLSGSPLD